MNKKAEKITQTGKHRHFVHFVNYHEKDSFFEIQENLN